MATRVIQLLPCLCCRHGEQAVEEIAAAYLSACLVAGRAADAFSAPRPLPAAAGEGGYNGRSRQKAWADAMSFWVQAGKPNGGVGLRRH